MGLKRTIFVLEFGICFGSDVMESLLFSIRGLPRLTLQLRIKKMY